MEALFRFPPFFNMAAKHVRPWEDVLTLCLLRLLSGLARWHEEGPHWLVIPSPCWQARAMIVKRGEKMGLDFEAEIDELRNVDWDQELQAVEDASVQVCKARGYQWAPFSKDEATDAAVAGIVPIFSATSPFPPALAPTYLIFFSFPLFCQYPAYYTVPFHAYPEGNLGWTPAMEMTVAARSVHSTVYDPTGKTLDPEVRWDGQPAVVLLVSKAQ